MNKRKYESIETLDELIVGRVEPKIYAFSTNTIPNYLKIGDTYRPVKIRLEEWEKEYPSIKKEYEGTAKVNEDVYFRDFSVHQYLENDLGKSRLCKDELVGNVYYSNEFFKDTDTSEINKAVSDIKENYKLNSGKYSYYNVSDMSPTGHHYIRGDKWKLRPNQLEVVENFKKAIENDRTNLLMYAVMRFGKSFTSLYCGLEMKAKLILVVSAKADVQEEWKKTVETAGNFKEYVFLNSYDLASDENKLKDTLKENVAVVFLTLQDLQGEEIKEKHQEIFENQIDLLIVDETHFGARAQSFGAVLQTNKQESEYLKKLEDEFIAQDDAEEDIKKINSKVRIHLSGTPYRILMGSEFEKEDIIAFVQFTDIVKEKENWDKENLAKDDKEEWDNPYYGFPQMVRFAFLPNKTSVEKMKEMQEEGISFKLSELLKPQSISRDNKKNRHKKFVYKSEILGLLKAIDGSELDDNIFPFLDYSKIKQGKMCGHMVMVLPYCASCDAMEKLLIDNKSSFKNLNNYEIINISGLDAGSSYKKPLDVKRVISDCEAKGKKTLTLTVNRMLTGSTVEQWDTMIFLKDTSSPQEYDQATFRLQNQYTRTLKNGDKIIKENLKPQTLLVDFNPHRLFVLQEQKSLVFNVNTDEKGNMKLKERLDDELRISPIIVMNENQIQQVESTDILNKISEYNSERSISDEVTDIPIDMGLLKDNFIRNIISEQPNFNSKAGLFFTAHEGEEIELDLDEISGFVYPEDIDGKTSPMNEETLDYDVGNKNEQINQEKENYYKKFQTYYQRILFYSFLVNKQVYSLDDIICTLKEESNKRIFENLGLHKSMLETMATQMDPFIRNRLDYKIQNISQLSFEKSKTPLERALTSLNKFNRLSESEVITPKAISDRMVNLIPEEGIKDIVKNGEVFLDIASKAAEYAVSIYKKLADLGYKLEDIKNRIYSIPTSTIAYELTRKFYEILGLNIENIAYEFNSYDLLEIKTNDSIDYKKIKNVLQQNKKFSEIQLDEEIVEGGNKVKFGAIVGNPPYNDRTIGESTQSPPIYHIFMDLSYSLSPRVCLITPSRFLFNAGATPKSWNRKILQDRHITVEENIQNAVEIFDGTDIKGGVVITFRDTNRIIEPIGTYIPYKELKTIVDKVKMNNFISLETIMRGQNSFKFTDKVHIDFPSLESKLSKGHKYDLTSSIFSRADFIFEKYAKNSEYLTIIGRQNNKRVKKHIPKEYIEKNEIIDTFNVFLPKSNGSGYLGEILSSPFVAFPLEGHTQTFISVGQFQTKIEAENLLKYIKSKFARALLGVLKITQDNPPEKWRYVPLQNFSPTSDIDWTQSIANIDSQLYKKYNLDEKEINFIENNIQSME